MSLINIKIIVPFLLVIGLTFLNIGCIDKSKNTNHANKSTIVYPSEVIPFMHNWRILLGDGTRSDTLDNFQKDQFFFVEIEDNTKWVVYKTPNSGITSKTSNNTRTELGEKRHWIPEVGGKLTGTLKVQHVSTTGDARVPSSYSVVIGQIHSEEGHKNEPLKIFYKKFPGHTKGSVFWNYEINTEGDNSGRWDVSTAVWGTNWAVLGTSKDRYPDEPEDGIALGEEFRYEINVYKGIMHLTFSSKGHETKRFEKNLLKSDFSKKENIPKQVLKVYESRNREGIERDSAYAGEIQIFKQGAYNQANGKSTKSETYNGDIKTQYAHGSYAEVWFKEATVGFGTVPDSINLEKL
ncbi:polysaccharide lyase family 7 protein [Cognatitamlana onchidii]|uniref:polysaccharide lyase family 7 protein n=1 Tax=Cognatitamlana onchidii TaxID=2562860 RepID=UPI0010A68129|nr:polysaccharide lyase family 7 protein [Algibacter onchidii]